MDKIEAVKLTLDNCTLTGTLNTSELKKIIGDGETCLPIMINMSSIRNCNLPDDNCSTTNNSCPYYYENKKVPNHCKLQLCQKQYEQEKEVNDVILYDITTHLRKLIKVDARHIYKYDGGIMHGRDHNKLKRDDYIKELQRIRRINNAGEIKSEIENLCNIVDISYGFNELKKQLNQKNLENMQNGIDSIISDIQSLPQESRVKSTYFIDTLEASYDSTDLAIMRNAITKLIFSHIPYSKSIENELDIDFILCLKTGNQILANSILATNGVTANPPLHICIRDDGNVCSPNNRDAISFKDQTYKYENWRVLHKAAKETDRRKPLKGILVDCAISDGQRIVSELNLFNDMIEKYRYLNCNEAYNIAKVTDAFVLQANFKGDNLDSKFGDIRIHRYFDTDEYVRKTIYDNRDVNSDAWVNKLFKYMEENGLTHFDR